MAKKSKIAKYQKQQALIEHYAEKRYALKQAGDIEAGIKKTSLKIPTQTASTVVMKSMVAQEE